MEHQSTRPNRNNLFCAVLIANLLFVSTGSTLAWPGPVITMLQLSVPDATLIGSSLALGGLISPWICALLLSVVGSKSSIIVTHVIFITSFMMFLTSKLLGILMTGRIIGGFAVELCLNIVPIYITEITDAKVRQLCKSFAFFFTGIGQMIEFYFGSKHNYILMQIVSVVPSVIFVFLLFTLPQPPIWLIHLNEDETALKSLSWYRGLPKEAVSSELDSIKVSVDENASNIYITPVKAFKKVFNEYNHRKAMICGLVVISFQVTTGYIVVVSYMEPLLTSEGIFSIPIIEISMMFSGIAMLSALICPVLITKFGFRKVLAGCYIGMGITLVPISIHMALEQYGHDMAKYDAIPLINLLVYSGLFASGGGFLPRAILAEIAPPLSQGVIFAICGSWNWFLTFIILLITPWLSRKQFGYQWIAFSLFSFLSIIGGVIVLLVIPETKGMTLLQIQNMMREQN